MRDGIEKRLCPYQGRGQSAERSEKRQKGTIKMGRSKDAMVGTQNGGMAQKRFGPHKGRGEIGERSEKR